MQNQPWTDGLVQVLDSGMAGFLNDRCDLSPPSNFPFAGSAGSPGQCLISISNYNFFNATDSKVVLPSSVNMTNNIGPTGAYHPLMNQMRYPGRGVPQSSLRQSGKIGFCIRLHTNEQPFELFLHRIALK